ncbi:MAG: hypothetical protein K6B65_02860 [Bacilli bacterium]|nr:hypothetical protein [Bacilli bacterium]
MKIEWKKSFKIAAILCAIAGVSAVLVSLANVVTEPIIATNKATKEKNGLQKVFGSDATYGEKKELSDTKYLLAYYPVTSSLGESRVYSTSGNNAYGTVSLLVGITSGYSLYNLVVMENTESYATTLNENYIVTLINSDKKDEALNEVKCGATYGAKLIRDMVNAAKDHYKEAKA